MLLTCCRKEPHKVDYAKQTSEATPVVPAGADATFTIFRNSYANGKVGSSNLVNFAIAGVAFAVTPSGAAKIGVVVVAPQNPTFVGRLVYRISGDDPTTWRLASQV